MAYRGKLQEKIIYATVSDKCYRIISQDSEEVPALQCQYEEAYFSMLSMPQERDADM